jgi:transcriptional regulator with XRE-family HTH domain
MEAATVLRRARRRSRLTLRELAGRAGTSHATLSAYEAGRKVPTVATLDRIVRAAGSSSTSSNRRWAASIAPPAARS